ncbi:MAG: hypothetical protein ACR2G6_16540 [Gemmatimonadaceae bacterium]
MTRHLLGFGSALVLFVLPGGWVAFGGGGVTLPLRSRLSLAVVLSPLIVVLQFYVLRWAGLDFNRTAFLLPLLNLPAAYLLVQRGRGVSLPGARTLLLWTAALLPVATYLALWMRTAFVRTNWGHVWTHTDIVYMLANGQLRPEEPQLAGIRLAYPWMGHVFQSTVSFLLNAAPNSSYILTNIIWVLAAIVLVAGIVESLGGDFLAQAMSAVLLPFGANSAGYVAASLVPDWVRGSYGVWGDTRYTPWLRKFGVFEPTIFGIGVFAALAFVLTRDTDKPMGRFFLVLAGALLLTVSLFYPILSPAALALVGGRVLVLIVRRVHRNDASARTEIGALILCALMGAIALAAHVSLITVDSAGGASLGLSSLYRLKTKTATAIIALSPLLLGLAFSARPLWRASPEKLTLLAFGAFASVVAYIGLDIFYISNEYKYMFTAAICLTPLAATAFGQLASRMGRVAIPAAVAVSVALLLAVLLHPRAKDTSTWRQLDASRFDLRLARGERYSMLTDAIRFSTPQDAVLVSRATPFDWVAVTRRAVYVPFDTGMLHGTGLASDFLLKRSRGYSEALVDRRRDALRQLYGGRDTRERASALRQIMDDLHRPIVLVARRTEDADLAEWLSSYPARLVYSGGTDAVWLVNHDRISLAKDDHSRRWK